MEVIREIKALRQRLRPVKQQGKTIGLVPTMGYLHEGHLSLLRAARAETDLVVMSLFVNPTQFGQGEDYDSYPRDLSGDTAKAAAAGCDIIFAPSAAEMYPQGYSTFVEVEGLTKGLCGASRPGHFKGVATVVSKLFNIVAPDRAYFGQKDGQQAQVIKKMVADLNMDLEIRVMPIVREADGLAMSSRNSYLSPEQRKAAPVMYRGLSAAEQAYKQGERDAARLKQAVADVIKQEKLVRVEYIELVDRENLTRVEQVTRPAMLAVAAHIGSTRLIDNILLGV